jgi:hypothetical protein
MNKLKIGIDINEILRARWLQFDKFYAQEFGENGILQPESHVYDFFKYYKWEDTIETNNELKEPEDLPENINPIDYQIDEKTGEAPADIFLFNKEKKKLTAKEMYNRFMYEDFVYEIHGCAPLMYNGLDLDLKKFYFKYKNNADFIILSKENVFSIPSTLFFLSKITCRLNNYCFVENAIDMWKQVDVLITTDPEILQLGIPWGKKLIKVNRPYNQNIKTGSMEITHFKELTNNKNFEKIIKYKNK